MENEFPHLRLGQKSIKMQTAPGSEHSSKLQMPVWGCAWGREAELQEGAEGQQGNKRAERVQADSSRCLFPSHFHLSAYSGFICHLEPHWWLLSSLSRDILVF